jgi:hypothetical protein
LAAGKPLLRQLDLFIVAHGRLLWLPQGRREQILKFFRVLNWTVLPAGVAGFISSLHIHATFSTKHAGWLAECCPRGSQFGLGSPSAGEIGTVGGSRVAKTTSILITQKQYMASYFHSAQRF